MRIAPVLGASLLAASCAGQCGARGGLPPPRPPTVKGPDGQKYHLVDKGPYKAFYDAWGRLQRIEYDSNGDGRADHIALHAGKRNPHRIDVDADFDGRTDRWEVYDEEGRLQKVGTARAPGEAPDLWTTADAAGAGRCEEPSLPRSRCASTCASSSREPPSRCPSKTCARFRGCARLRGSRALPKTCSA